MLQTVPDDLRRRFRVRVLADSGFEAAVFLDEVRQLGFEFVVGVRNNRRTLHPGEVTVADCSHGGYVELKNRPHDTLVLGRFDRGDRVFHAVASELLSGDEVIAEGAKRWNEESFFKEGKHQFGAQAHLRYGPIVIPNARNGPISNRLQSQSYKASLCLTLRNSYTLPVASKEKRRPFLQARRALHSSPSLRC